MTILSIAFTFFLVANPIGNSPAIIALIKDFDLEKQQKIMFRESLVALIIALFFQYFGDLFLGELNIKQFTVSLTGGVLLLLVALDMIFSPHVSSKTVTKKREPVIVPIATPLLAGPALLTIIMLFTQKEDPIKISSAICLAWVAIGALLMCAPYLQKILKKRGLGALEQLMGMILSMMAMEMIVQGLKLFIEVL